MKRFLRAVLIVFGILLAIYVVALAVLSISPKVEDRDLLVSRETLSAEANAFTSLQTAAGQMVLPDETEISIWQLAAETNWNDTAAAEVLAKNQPTLAALDAALAAPGFQVPEFRFADQLSYLSDWKKLAQLAAIRGNVRFREGKEREAFEQALNLVRLGNRMGNSRGLLHHLVGTSVNSLGLAQMRRWAGRTHLPPQELAALAAQLKTTIDDGTALANSLKVEYQKSMEMLADLRAGKLEGSELAPLISVRFLPTFNSGKTRLLFANNLREILKALPLHYCDAKLPDFEHKRPGTLRLLLGGNVAGEVCYYQMMPSLMGSLATKNRQNVQAEGTRLTLALRAYHLKNGRLPEDLASLVPGFLDQVPADSFDGKPMRYDRERKLVYSIGPNLRDDDGQDKDEQKHPLDYPFPLEF